MKSKKTIPVVILFFALILAIFLSLNRGGEEMKITRRYENGKPRIGEKQNQDGTILRMYWNPRGVHFETRIYKGKELLQKTTYRARRLFSETFYRDNKRVKAKWYYLQGGLSDLREYKNGIPHGRWAYWNKRGKLISDVRYENGKMITK